MNINKDDFSPEVYQIILEAGKKEKTRIKRIILFWALVIMALAIKFIGYPFIREQAAPFESPLIEHKLLTYIDITDEERLPSELLDTLLAEYIPEHLKKFWDKPLELGIADVNERETEATEEMLEIFRSIPDRTGVNLSSRVYFYKVWRNEHSIDVMIKDGSTDQTAYYTYFDDGIINKGLTIQNERIRMDAFNYKGKIKIKYDRSLGLPDQIISVEDYQNYMEARRAGEIRKQQLLSIAKMQEYAKMNAG